MKGSQQNNNCKIEFMKQIEPLFVKPCGETNRFLPFNIQEGNKYLSYITLNKIKPNGFRVLSIGIVDCEEDFCDIISAVDWFGDDEVDFVDVPFAIEPFVVAVVVVVVVGVLVAEVVIVVVVEDEVDAEVYADGVEEWVFDFEAIEDLLGNEFWTTKDHFVSGAVCGCD
ncbi:unnamed protein product [[Candida] boidinii]|uniref:Unnamed protein product n=1 Tax=Candida boidinii TaxID=5477 RepID=A0A9W6T8G5_CANBO|nr:unnamed protein product [[Candida] boidinii]GME97059.1 unnamed protein product [[Candida] boidinii]